MASAGLLLRVSAFRRNDTGDTLPCKPQLYAVGLYTDDEGLVLLIHRKDRADDAPVGHHLISVLQTCKHILHLLPLPLGGEQNEKIHNAEHRHNGQESEQLTGDGLKNQGGRYHNTCSGVFLVDSTVFFRHDVASGFALERIPAKNCGNLPSRILPRMRRMMSR